MTRTWCSGVLSAKDIHCAMLGNAHICFLHSFLFSHFAPQHVQAVSGTHTTSIWSWQSKPRPKKNLLFWAGMNIHIEKARVWASSSFKDLRRAIFTMTLPITLWVTFGIDPLYSGFLRSVRGPGLFLRLYDLNVILILISISPRLRRK